MFRRILVPVDGSPPATLGLEKAIELAADQRASLHVLHVIDEAAVVPGMEGAMYVAASLIDGLHNALRESGKLILATAETKAREHDVKCQTVLVDSCGRRIADVILAQARKVRADLIVMGTHGRRGLVRMVMGSDAEGVLRSARSPVLLVRR